MNIPPKKNNNLENNSFNVKEGAEDAKKNVMKSDATEAKKKAIEFIVKKLLSKPTE